MQFCMIFTTSDKQDIIKKLAAILVQEKLAACVQIDQINSVYEWEGKICESAEFRLLIKSRAENFTEVERLIKKNHNYSLPEIIKVDITSGSQEYLDWMGNVC